MNCRAPLWLLRQQWAGIVWFQGENNIFVDHDNTHAYEQNLARFIGDLRSLIYTLDKTVFATPSSIPVVIVQVGCWIQGIKPRGPVIAKAQANFVQNEQRMGAKTSLVYTKDLSCNSHYDEASQLIIGYRVASALQTLLPPIPSTIMQALQLTMAKNCNFWGVRVSALQLSSKRLFASAQPTISCKACRMVPR